MLGNKIGGSKRQIWGLLNSFAGFEKLILRTFKFGFLVLLLLLRCESEYS